MQLVTVGSKYQIVIPWAVRNKIKGLKPGSKVGLQIFDENTATINFEAKSWVERTRGMMKEAWKGIDTDKELNKIRDEWEERLQKIERQVK